MAPQLISMARPITVCSIVSTGEHTGPSRHCFERMTWNADQTTRKTPAAYAIMTAILRPTAALGAADGFVTFVSYPLVAPAQELSPGD